LQWLSCRCFRHRSITIERTDAMKINVMLVSMFLAIAGGLSAAEDSHEMDKEAVLVVHIDNGTEGGSVAEGTPVTVDFYHGDHRVKQVSVETDSEGNCMITGIPAGNDIVAVAQARHSAMAFSSAPLSLVPGQKRHHLSFQVFDVTNENDLIRVGTHHLIVKSSGNNLHVTEYIQLLNDSDRAILSDVTDNEGRPKVIEMSLPESFKGLSFSSYFHPGAVVQTPGGFYDTMAIPPGSYHAVFSYDVPLTSDTIEFTKAMMQSTDSLMVFVQAGGVTVTGIGEPVGQMTLQDGIPADYYTVDVSKGEVLKFKIEGLAIRKPQKNVWMILGIVFGIVVLVALFRLKRG